MKKFIVKSAFTAALLSLAATANAASYKEIEVSGGGSIAGTVAAGSATAETKTFTISKDPEICGEGTRDVQFVRVNGDAILDAVVFLDKVKEGKAIPEELNSLTLTQEKCTFSPFLGVMANKGELTAVNADHTLHNIHTYELIGKARRTVFNVSQPTAGDMFTKQVKLRKGAGMKIECDAHDFMHGFVFVARNPYFAVVDENGAFEIGDIPPGTYNIKVWHGQLGEIKGGKVEVTADGVTTVDLSF